MSNRVLLIKLAKVRIIVAKDFALLFEPDSDASQGFLEELLARLAQRSGARAMQGVVSEGLLDGDMNDYVSADLSATQAALPFELEVVERVLDIAANKLDNQLVEVSRMVSNVNSVLPGDITRRALEDLRQTKQALVGLESASSNLKDLLLDVLDDDEEVREMVLSSTASTEEELDMQDDVVEDLLEYYLQRAENCHNEAERLLENTRDLEESIGVNLSARRYEVSKLELLLSISTFAIAVGALVTGIFGMNLRSTLEMSVRGFYLTVLGIAVGCTTIFKAITNYTRRRQIL